MTHRSLFKEVAQRIVQSAQAPQDDGRPVPQNLGGPQARRPLASAPMTQMTGSHFNAGPASMAQADALPSSQR